MDSRQKRHDELRKALDKFPRHGLAKEERDQCPICIEQEKALKNLKQLFSAFQELSLAKERSLRNLFRSMYKILSKARTHDNCLEGYAPIGILVDQAVSDLNDLKQLFGEAFSQKGSGLKKNE